MTRWRVQAITAPFRSAESEYRGVPVRQWLFASFALISDGLCGGTMDAYANLVWYDAPITVPLTVTCIAIAPNPSEE